MNMDLSIAFNKPVNIEYIIAAWQFAHCYPSLHIVNWVEQCDLVLSLTNNIIILHIKQGKTKLKC